MYPLNMRKKLTLVPIGGLANRLYAITSAIAFCEDHDIDLKVVWFKDWGMGADFHALFELTGNHPHVEIVDATWKDYIYDRPRKKNFWLPYLYQRFAYDQCVYESAINKGYSNNDLKDAFCRYKAVYLVHYCSFYPSRKGNICPSDDLMQLIDRKKADFQINKDVIGVHIRRTDNTLSILNSPLSLFIEKMQYEISVNPIVRFYVASDDLNEKRKLQERFGDRILTSFDEVRRDNERGIIDAVVEMYLLASTKKIYGSSASTYSQYAAELGGIDIEIVKRDSNGQ